MALNMHVLHLLLWKSLLTQPLIQYTYVAQYITQMIANHLLTNDKTPHMHVVQMIVFTDFPIAKMIEQTNVLPGHERK